MYAFIDIETTGLDRDANFIIEVAWVFTDAHYNVMSSPQSFLVDVDEWSLVFEQIEASEFLTNMHTESGLLAELSDPSVPKYPMGHILGTFVREALALGAGVEEVKFAGYSVSFDREFLSSNGCDALIYTDRLGFQLHHRILDISSIIQFLDGADIVVPSVQNPNPHRALEDVINSLRTVQEMTKTVGYASA